MCREMVGDGILVSSKVTRVGLGSFVDNWVMRLGAMVGDLVVAPLTSCDRPTQTTVDKPKRAAVNGCKALSPFIERS
jgi:hypothetical protein